MHKAARPDVIHFSLSSSDGRYGASFLEVKNVITYQPEQNVNIEPAKYFDNLPLHLPWTPRSKSLISKNSSVVFPPRPCGLKILLANYSSYGTCICNWHANASKGGLLWRHKHELITTSHFVFEQPYKGVDLRDIQTLRSNPRTSHSDNTHFWFSLKYN